MQRLKVLAHQYPEFIIEVRGKGLLIGIQMHNDAQVSELTEVCLQQKLMVTPTRNAVLRIIPNLLLSEEELEAGIATLALALEVMRSRNAASVQALCA